MTDVINYSVSLAVPATGTCASVGSDIRSRLMVLAMGPVGKAVSDRCSACAKRQQSYCQPQREVSNFAHKKPPTLIEDIARSLAARIAISVRRDSNTSLQIRKHSAAASSSGPWVAANDGVDLQRKNPGHLSRAGISMLRYSKRYLVVPVLFHKTAWPSALRRATSSAPSGTNAHTAGR